MNLKANMILQVLMLVSGVLNYILPIADGEVKFAIATAINFVQLVTSLYAHYYNPDGSRAEAPWVKNK